MAFTPGLNLPKRHRKGLVKMFTGNAGSGIPSPFYHTTSVVAEGTPMKLHASVADRMEPCQVGQNDGAKCRGLALQATYDESAFDPALRGYHFANNTKQRLDGMPIGLLMGSGYAMTLNYSGDVAWGNAAYIGASGKLVASGDTGDKLPIVFEGSGSDGDKPVRIRFDFPVN